MNAQRRHIQTDRRTDTPIDQTMPFYCMCPETFKKKRLTQIFRNQKQDKNVEMKTKNGKADETHNEVKIYEKDLQFKTKPIPCFRLLLRQFSRARKPCHLQWACNLHYSLSRVIWGPTPHALNFILGTAKQQCLWSALESLLRLRKDNNDVDR